MRKIYTILIVLLVTASTFAQAPEKMSYQAVVRDGRNTLLANEEVGIRISILQTTMTGVSVYTETHSVTTNLNGLVSLEIGTGSTSDSFATTDWSAGPYFIKTEIDQSGGGSYTITGTSQIMSVPFALYANYSGSSETNATNIANNTTAIAANTAKTVAAEELTGTSLNSTIVGSSLTSVGILTGLTVTGTTETGLVKITGGTPGLGKVLTSDAVGMAIWAAAAVSVTEVDDEFTATTSQTAFTLSQAPSANSKVKMYVNGIRISKTAYTYSSSGTSLTYDPATNGGYQLTAGDRIQVDYFY